MFYPLPNDSLAESFRFLQAPFSTPDHCIPLLDVSPQHGIPSQFSASVHITARQDTTILGVSTAQIIPLHLSTPGHHITDHGKPLLGVSSLHRSTGHNSTTLQDIAVHFSTTAQLSARQSRASHCIPILDATTRQPIRLQASPLLDGKSRHFRSHLDGNTIHTIPRRQNSSNQRMPIHLTPRRQFRPLHSTSRRQHTAQHTRSPHSSTAKQFTANHFSASGKRSRCPKAPALVFLFSIRAYPSSVSPSGSRCFGTAIFFDAACTTILSRSMRSFTCR